MATVVVVAEEVVVVVVVVVVEVEVVVVVVVVGVGISGISLGGIEMVSVCTGLLGEEGCVSTSVDTGL